MIKYFPILLIVISFIIALYIYPQMPQLMATHWGISGEVNGYSPRAFGLFFLPVLLVIMYGLFLFLPKVDPYKKNFKEFKGYYENFIIITFSFLFYLFLLMITWNLDYHFELIKFLSPGFALLFGYAGVLMSKTKRNWFVGIRTPWTISSSTVWSKTHRLGSKLFYFTALLALLGFFFPKFAIFFILIPTILSTFLLFAYSYFEYQKIKK